MRAASLSQLSVDVEDPASREAQQCLANYFQELAGRFDAGFDPARGISATAAELTPPHGFFVMARLNGEPVGCGALKCHPDYGEIKRRLPVLRLETNKALTEAQSLYKSSGYREVAAFNDEPYAHHWFEKTL